MNAPYSSPVRRQPQPRPGFFPTVWLLLLALLPARLPAAAVTNLIPTLAELRLTLSNQVAAPRFQAAAWGVKITSLDTGKTLFEHDAGKLLSPASNAKLFTVALGFDRLGGDYRMRTSLYARARPARNGTLDGDLILFGRGDPGFRAGLHSNDLFRALQPLVAALTNAGVHRVKGDLLADASFLAGPAYGAGWAWDDLQNYYGAPLSALTLNDNCVTLTTRPGAHIGDPPRFEFTPPRSGLRVTNSATTGPAGASNTFRLERRPDEQVVRALGQLPLGAAALTEELPVADPARWFGELFKQALARHGVRVDGGVRAVNWIDRQLAPLDFGNCIELGAVESAPLRELAGWILKPSQNLYTDLLLGHVGSLVLATNRTSPGESSEDAGVRELGCFLRSAGMASGQVVFEEGSGLSRNNLVTAAALVSLLDFMHRHRCADAWREALPIAGVDGTLRRRLKGTAAEANVRAKTGTLRWASSLSGYVTTAAGEQLAFSLMLNRYQSSDRTRTAREELDAIAVWLASFAGRSDAP